ncbi:Pyruvate:ferredoxin oxidoreductase and related 2-oxoacid:ferredoxin oxidoreductases, alpha subunit [Candidatus Sulfotelmatomonas gaucii]|uniref:Pyruvate:ferredoxin oxidoreductase and related 2-oxoacid:ferredoxin oxidoreductases, alpha subunit n=1 Tax=Candidatus Sulfuritelmatomonas gaucii TaxID=2043161 RepID=A0A2N9LVE6_9BACT|nr:Pyruvate:ferredoxin oxidoreductase and related 2-oxoacid:ferredoxin oxidoreductases, alpha subunit [Candidatus Sulfotelmatomonas gaucii]
MKAARYPGIRVTANGNQLVSYHTETRIADAGVFYPITPSTEGGELFQQAFAEGKLNVFGGNTIAIETEGEHAAQGGAIAHSVCGKRVVNFTSGQGVVYGVEQYYHAPGKGSTMVLEVGARALTKHALNVHCGHDDIYGALDTGWIMLFGKDAQQAADQALILRRVTELSLTPGMNIMDGFLTTHLERTFYKHESELIREYLGAPDDVIDSPTEAQRVLFGPTRRRVPKMMDLTNPVLMGPVQNQEHYMQGVIARRNNFAEPILGFLEDAYEKFAELTGRRYGLISEYKTEDAETVFVSLGSAAENIEAAVDYLRQTRGASVGSIHLNVIRPFPEAAVVNALKGKKNVIILERTDEALSGDNPMGRDIRTAFSKAVQGTEGLPKVELAEVPLFFGGSYGLGSRDFRPEHIIGAFEYATAGRARQDGKKAADGANFFVLGIDHPYAVIADEMPSLLPEGAVAVRFHSVGGWGAITTGKNLGAILGDLNDLLFERDHLVDALGNPKEVIHVSANPKYGSEKKGAPTSYFMVAAKDRIRVNCDLRHVTVVLCCDPKAFTHTNPLDGMQEGGCLIWESDVDGERAWENLPLWARKQIIQKKIRVFTLPGFDIAKKATDRGDLQLRMQGNAFLGAFFAVSPMLQEFGITQEQFREVVHKQYVKKFGKLGDAVVQSNMEVMIQGFERVKEIAIGEVTAADRSSLRGRALLPIIDQASEFVEVAASTVASMRRSTPVPAGQGPRTPISSINDFDAQFRSHFGYNQPATPLAAMGVIAAATGDTASKYVARRETPLYIPENCTQCMECISVCPDTALPNCSQDLGTILSTAVTHYVSDTDERRKIMARLPEIEKLARQRMLADIKQGTPMPTIIREVTESVDGFSAQAKEQFFSILEKVPMAYQKANAIFSSPERKTPGSGGIFSIFVSDLCKGCAACVTACGDHEALKMVQETEDVNAEHETGTAFLDLLPDTSQKYLGLFNGANPADSKTATLRNMLMVRTNYDALVSGDGACAGCGEKSVLRSIAAVTEAYMRPVFHAKSDRLVAKAGELEKQGAAKLAAVKESNPAEYALLRQAIEHLLMGLGGEDVKDTKARIAAYEKESGEVTDAQLIEAIAAVLLTEAFNHKNLQPIDGRLANGMSVMAMAAHTGCNTVYGSTSPNNPHPYPWMNSLFQDGITVGWLMGESFIVDHGRRSVIPERLADIILTREGKGLSEEEYYHFTHFTDALMTDQEIVELPKVWVVGGDGGMGDIGYQNMSKVILQNRPNVKALMLDTQVYSNTGGQNSDSTPMLGGGDMNTFGAATQGKNTEKKTVAETFLAGHGSPFVAQVSMANAPKLYRAILDGLEYRGTMFIQAYTTCQPEHGVPDDMALFQAQRVRDSRGVPEFVFDPRKGESYQEALDIKGNPSIDLDWYETKSKATGEPYRYTVAHWCTTEARFRNHLKKIKPEQAEKLIPLENMLVRITQQDVVYRRYLHPEHRSFIPDFGVYIQMDQDSKAVHYALSRQLVMFCVERRKAWRMLQSKAGIKNREYDAQKAIFADLDAGKIANDEFFAHAHEIMAERLGKPVLAKA